MKALLIRNVSWSFASKITQVVIGAASMVILARVLGPEQFGILTWMLAAATLLALVPDLGLSSASARMLAEDAGGRARTIVLVSSALLGGLVATAGLAVIAFSEMLARALNAPFLEGMAWVLATLMVVRVGQRFCEKAFEGLRRVDILARATISLSWIGPLAAVLGVVLIAPTAFVALALKAGAGVFVVVVLTFGLSRYVHSLSRHPSAAARRSWADVAGSLARYSPPLFVVTLSFVIYTQSDVLMIQWLLDVEDVGVYGAAVRIVEMFAVAGAAIGAGSAAFFPRARARGRREYSELFLQATRGVLLVYLPIAGGLLLTAGEVMPMVFGHEFAGAGLILAVYTPFIVSRGLSSVYSLSLDYLGFAGFRALAVGLSASANVIVNLLLIPRFGILGAAVASQVTYVPLVVTYGVVLMRESGTSARRLRATVMPILGATAVMMIAVIAGMLAGVPVLAMIPVGVTVYLVTAIRMGAVTTAEVAGLVRFRTGAGNATDDHTLR